MKIKNTQNKNEFSRNLGEHDEKVIFLFLLISLGKENLKEMKMKVKEEFI